MISNKKIIDEIVSIFPFLNEVNQNWFNIFIDNISIKKYPAGSLILEQGSICNNMVFILEGTIRVYKLSPEGREITLYRLGKGDTCILSIFCIMGELDYPAIATVAEAATLAVIPSKLFHELFFSDLHCQKYIFNTLLNRLQEVMLLVDEVVFKPMDKRLASFLFKKIKSNNDNKLLEITHEKIATELGTAREVVSRVLKDFERRDMVSLGRGKIVVDNLEKITNIIKN